MRMIGGSFYLVRVIREVFSDALKFEQSLVVENSSAHQYLVVVGRIMASKGVHTLILGTSDYVTLYAKMYFTDMIKIKVLEMERSF